MCGRLLRGSHMGGILKKLIDKAPDIIGKAAQSKLGVASLSVLVLGIVEPSCFEMPPEN